MWSRLPQCAPCQACSARLAAAGEPRRRENELADAYNAQTVALSSWTAVSASVALRPTAEFSTYSFS